MFCHSWLESKQFKEGILHFHFALDLTDSVTGSAWSPGRSNRLKLRVSPNHFFLPSDFAGNFEFLSGFPSGTQVLLSLDFHLSWVASSGRVALRQKSLRNGLAS